MEHILKNWKRNAERNREKNFNFIRSLKSKDPDRVDKVAREEHKQAFERIDCTQCGNCCRVRQPLVTDQDMEGIAEFLNVSVEQVKEDYLLLDEDNDWVTNSSPCPFLNLENNHCNIYEVRPGECKGYPYTDREYFASRSYGHTANSLDCPAVFHIIEEMKVRIGGRRYR